MTFRYLKSHNGQEPFQYMKVYGKLECPECGFLLYHVNVGKSGILSLTCSVCGQLLFPVNEQLRKWEGKE